MKAKLHNEDDDDKQWSGWRHGVKIPQARDSLLGQTLQAPLHAAATGLQPDAEVLACILVHMIVHNKLFCVPFSHVLSVVSAQHTANCALVHSRV
jgi:hypothetical protein